jgi:hypothetical protein
VKKKPAAVLAGALPAEEVPQRPAPRLAGSTAYAASSPKPVCRLCKTARLLVCESVAFRRIIGACDEEEGNDG